MIAPARTGSDNSSKITVNNVAHTNNGTRSKVMVFGRMFIIVEMKLIAPRIDLAPAKWREKIARSTGNPLWNIFLANGGYTVHPVPTPLSTNADKVRRKIDGNSSHSLRLFNRGNAMSGAPSIIGSSQLPNPPISTGITKKKIIINAWAVTIVLYSWLLFINNPGCVSSIRIIALILVPMVPAHVPNSR